MFHLVSIFVILSPQNTIFTNSDPMAPKTFTTDSGIPVKAYYGSEDAVRGTAGERPASMCT